eukprot:scaffold27774_cov38-Tisochrysis_lutea.AAC.2
MNLYVAEDMTTSHVDQVRIAAARHPTCYFAHKWPPARWIWWRNHKLVLYNMMACVEPFVCVATGDAGREDAGRGTAGREAAGLGAVGRGAVGPGAAALGAAALGAAALGAAALGAAALGDVAALDVPGAVAAPGVPGTAAPAVPGAAAPGAGAPAAPGAGAPGTGAHGAPGAGAPGAVVPAIDALGIGSLGNAAPAVAVPASAELAVPASAAAVAAAAPAFALGSAVFAHGASVHELVAPGVVPVLGVELAAPACELGHASVRPALAALANVCETHASECAYVVASAPPPVRPGNAPHLRLVCSSPPLGAPAAVSSPDSRGDEDRFTLSVGRSACILGERDSAVGERRSATLLASLNSALDAPDANTGITGLRQRRAVHACFFTPEPPNLGLSRQLWHSPHSGARHPEHFPHRVDRRASPSPSRFSLSFRPIASDLRLCGTCAFRRTWTRPPAATDRRSEARAGGGGPLRS